MIVKTAELIGRPLDWAVAKADGRNIEYDTVSYWVVDDRGHGVIGWQEKRGGYSPSTLGGDAYPIIEREWLDPTPWPNEPDEGQRWTCVQHDLPESVEAKGPTLLIAAMRCFVLSKLGAEVDVPGRLVKEPT